MAVKRGNTELNQEIARIFYEMADLLDIQNVRWKPQAYRLAAQTLESLHFSVEELYKKDGDEGINNLPGIGEAMTKKIIQYIHEKKIDEHERLKRSIPAGIYSMMQVPGVGARKASYFYNKLGIKSIDELARAAEEHRLIGPGFKIRAEQKILEGIELMKSEALRISRNKAKLIGDKIHRELTKLKEVAEVITAGSFRRKKLSIRDLDIVVRTEKPEMVLKKFVKMEFVKDVLGVGKEKATIITREGIQVDCRVFTKNEFGAGLLYFTGDKQHNIWLRKIAIREGWKLNEYGLFENKSRKRIAGKTEEEIYSKLGLSYILPEKRIGEVKQ